MPKKESIQQKLKRIRPPRVQITYDVEIGGAIEMKELPFVVGVLGDFSGQPDAAAAAAEGPEVRSRSTATTSTRCSPAWRRAWRFASTTSCPTTAAR